MKVLFLNNDGGGFADYVEVAEGTTIASFLQKHVPDANAADLLIRVNRQPVSRDATLQDGDRISATPVKIQGARVTQHIMRL